MVFRKLDLGHNWFGQCKVFVYHTFLGYVLGMHYIPPYPFDTHTRNRMVIRNFKDSDKVYYNIRVDTTVFTDEFFDFGFAFRPISFGALVMYMKWAGF